MSKPIRYLLALVVILAMAAASILVNKYGLEHSIGAHKQIKELDAGKTSEASPAKEKVGTATQAPSTPATIAASSKVDKQLPIVQMYPCSDGSPAGLQQEGFANPLRITGGFEAYTGCRIVHVDSVHEDMQFLIGMRVEHPYTGQSCKDGHKCLALWKDVRFGSYPEEGKLLRIVNPSGAWFITRPTP